MKKFSFLLFLIIIIPAAFLAWWIVGSQAPNPLDKSTKIFIIQKGDTVRQVGNSLKSQGLIRDPVVFFLTIKFTGEDTSIQAGDYKLSPSMNLSTILDTLKHGILDKWITFKEGQRADEYADILKATLPQYKESWRAILDQSEGYLFPDTYLIPRGADINSIVSILTNNFYQKVATLGLTKNSPNLNKVVIVASILEREANNSTEKPIIAGILQNRLNQGIPLQIDATVQYAKGFDGKTWWPEITQDDYQSVRSPYNTYLITGLPPEPISNPGLASLQAALHPANTPYLYYLHDSSGNIHYAKTEAEHEANFEKYK